MTELLMLANALLLALLLLFLWVTRSVLGPARGDQQDARDMRQDARTTRQDSRDERQERK